MNTYRKTLRSHLQLLVFAGPAMLLILLSAILPFLMSLYYSMTKWNGIGKTIQYIGLKNFRELLMDDPGAFKALFFTLKFAILNVVLTNSLAIVLALVLVSALRSRNMLRAAFFVPNIVSLVIIGFMWKFIFTRGFDSLYDLSGFTFLQWSWLGSGKLAFLSILLVNVWQSVGFFMIIYIIGLQSIPADLLESAAIDGVTGIRRFFTITLPLLMPSLTVSFFLTISNSLKVFDIIYTLTSGGPGGTTNSISIDIYKEAFVNNRFGYATAKSLLFVILILIITVVQVKFFKSREVEA